ncbi:MAG: 4-hydroxythreonine-4-phosphate dehydrogenase PdxA [Planctomycetota bacterium]
MSRSSTPRSKPPRSKTGRTRAPDLPAVSVSMGDPGGIGPEVLVKALADEDRRVRARWAVFGLDAPMRDAAERAGIDPFWERVTRDDAAGLASWPIGVTLIDGEPDLAQPKRWPARDTPEAGELSFRFVEDAIGCCRLAEDHPLRAHGVCTAPISKKGWDLAGKGRFPGHTELLAVRFGAERAGMMFESPSLRVMLATVHLPLLQIRDVFTIGCVFDAIELGHAGCRMLGIKEPRIAVCGLNPHAGEGGILGDEEQRIIVPAMKMARQQGIDAQGPFPGDTVFNAAVAGDFDLVVAMYHDQGLIPVKLLHRDDAVNMTVGLPVPRTSPDHGTAFDLAGQDRARPGSMAAALDLAARLASGTPERAS